VIAVVTLWDILLSTMICAISWKVARPISCEYALFTEIIDITINVNISKLFRIGVPVKIKILNLLFFPYCFFVKLCNRVLIFPFGKYLFSIGHNSIFSRCISRSHFFNNCCFERFWYWIISRDHFGKSDSC